MLFHYTALVSNVLRLVDPPLDQWIVNCKGEPFSGTNIDGKQAHYVLQRLLGTGGKGVVFTAVLRDNPTGPVYVLKFPTFDFTYVDPTDSPRKALDKLKGYLGSQEFEYREEYRRSRQLLEDCDCAHATIDLIGCTYEFRGDSNQDCSVPLKVGVQNLLESSEWIALDDYILNNINQLPADALNLPATTISFTLWRDLAISIATALKEVHDCRVVHGDIWAPNVFVHHKNKDLNVSRIKLIDFGNSWSTEYVSAQLGGGRRDSYAPPEERRAILPKTEASDAFGFGVLLLWLLIGPGAISSAGKDRHHQNRLLLAYLRRKAIDREIRSIVSRHPHHAENTSALFHIANGLIAEQLEALKDLCSLTSDDAERLEKLRKQADSDERVLTSELSGLLEEEYARNPKPGYPAPSKYAEKCIAEWKRFGWLKRRLYRPCESMIYDPGEVNLEDGSIQRRLVRDKILSVPQARTIYKSNPWIVDLIVRCLASDQTKRPRMVDVVRELQTNGFSRKVGDPLQIVSAHRLKVLGLSEVHKPALVDQLDLKDYRDLLIEYMSVCLSSLGGKDIYAAVTTLNMWQAQGLGHNGRFFTANLQALQNGSSIRRVFVTSLEELGSRYIVQLLVRLAIELGVVNPHKSRAPESDFSKLIKSLNDLHSLEVVNFSDRTRSLEKLRAFECFLHSVRVALKDQLTANVAAASDELLHEGSLLVSNSAGREDARMRFKKVLEAYVLLERHFDARLRRGSSKNIIAIYPHQVLPSEALSCEDRVDSLDLADDMPGLFLGLRIESSASRALNLRSQCPRSIIQSEFSMWPNESSKHRYVMMETEARGRSGNSSLVRPELNRVRIFYSKMEKSPTVSSFQRILYGLDRMRGDVARQGHLLPAVNIGCILPELVKVVAVMEGVDVD